MLKQMFRCDSTSGLIHYVFMTSLKPGTTYYYTIGDPADPTSLCAISTLACVVTLAHATL